MLSLHKKMQLITKPFYNQSKKKSKKSAGLIVVDVAGGGLRVAGCRLRVAECEMRVADFEAWQITNNE
jgi:hypothetical protein